MEEDPVLALVKFGAAEHMADLCTHGHLYMQSVAYFRGLDADAARSDVHEGLRYCYQASNTIFQVRVADSWTTVGGIQGPMLHRTDGNPVGNVYCMFALRGSHAEAFHCGHTQSLVDVERLAFGDTAVVFTNGDEFLRRVRTAAQNEGLHLQQHVVEYVDRRTYHGPMGSFRKFSEFTYQSELRLLVKPEAEGARSLVLGSLEDIAMLCPLVELNRRLRIRTGRESCLTSGRTDNAARCR